MTVWREISVRVAKAEVEHIEGILSDHGAVVVTISSAERSEEIFDILDNQFRLWPYVEIVGLFDQDFECDALLIALSLEGVDQQHLSVRELADQDWVLRWQNDQRPMAFGNGLYVCPLDTPVPADAKHIVRLAPGMAFGTGSHPTTAMSLTWIAAQDWRELHTAVDFGCGSAVLAIAMAKCGASSVFGCDIDPTAIEVSKQNIANNALQNVYVSLNQQLPKLEAEVLVANILLEPLIAEKQAILDSTVAGAKVALSGILSAQVEQLVSSFAPEFELSLVDTEEDWALVAGTRL